MKEGKIRAEPDAVLESVRRLVNGSAQRCVEADAAVGPTPSAESPLPAAPTPEADRDAEAPLIDERLLLTPSLRVEDEGEAADAVHEPSLPPVSEPMPDPETAPAAQVPFEAVVDALVEDGDALDERLEDRIAELEAAVSSQEGSWEPDGSELIDEETPREFVFGHHRHIDTTGTVEVGVRESAPGPEPLPQMDDAPMSPNAPEPEPLGVHLIDETDLPRPLAVDRAEAVALAEAGRQEALADAIQEEQAENAFSDEPLLLDTSMAEDDEGDADALLPEAAAAVARVAHVPTTTEAPVSEPGLPAEPEDVADTEEMLPALGADDIEIDEDMLRDLVAEIVRAELQGEMGVRITRNVRKLVRREIHRALMTRDFG
ncbi:MAG: hypothetical protein AAF771_15260 [Pseudomonadota bacterium]